MTNSNLKEIPNQYLGATINRFIELLNSLNSTLMSEFNISLSGSKIVLPDEVYEKLNESQKWFVSTIAFNNGGSFEIAPQSGIGKYINNKKEE